MAVFSYVLGRILQDSCINPAFLVDLGFSGNFSGNFLSKKEPKKAGNIRLFGAFQLATFLAILPLLRAICPLDGIGRLVGSIAPLDVVLESVIIQLLSFI